MACDADPIADLGLDLCVLARHLYAKHRASPAAAFRELTLRTRVPFSAADARLATSFSALRGTAWHRVMSARWSALRARIRSSRGDALKEAAGVVQTLFPRGCAAGEYAEALQTCASMLTSSIPANRLAPFVARRVAELRAARCEAVRADEIARDLVERPLIDALCPARWWERRATTETTETTEAETTETETATARAVAMRVCPPRLSIFYARDGGDVRVRHVALAGLLHATGPTAPLARRLVRSHGAIIGEEQLRGYLLRMQRMMAAERDMSEQRREKETESESAGAWRPKDKGNAPTEAPLVAEASTSEVKGKKIPSAPNKADVTLLYREPEAALADVDLNDADAMTLREFKDKMEEGFQEKVVRPGDPEYVYDKRVEVRPTQRSDWDDSD